MKIQCTLFYIFRILYFQNGENKFELTLRANCKIHELSEIISTNIKIPSKYLIFLTIDKSF